jgi:Rv2525c-like, glycoside hydrolase-like domain
MHIYSWLRMDVLRRLLALFTAALIPTAMALFPVSTPTPAAASFGISQHMGFDACSAPSPAQMQAFWTNTPFWNIGIYIGGALRACSQPNLTSSWLQNEGPSGVGWHFLPIWVGPQAPCSGFSETFSSDPSTAYQQGRNEALSAYYTAVNLGMDVQDAPIIYDLEAFDSSNAGCVAAAQQFIQGWVDQLHVPVSQLAGVYGSSCASALSAFASLATPPDFIFGADWNNNPSTADLVCVPSGDWANEQRHKQYAGGHNETWNGVTLNIDSDCSNGPVYPAPDSLGGTDGCAPGAASPASGTAVTEAAQLTPQFGWALRGGRLLRTGDDGKTWHDVTAPGLTGGVRTAAFLNARDGWMASAAAGEISVARTSDGGHTWRTTTLHTSADIASLRLSFGSPSTGVLLARRVSSSNFSLADLYVTRDGGATWSLRRAPAAGDISVAASGHVWLAGGAGGTKLFSSVDLGAHWVDATPHTGEAAAAVGLPLGHAEPVTTVDRGHSKLDFISAGRKTGTVPLSRPIGQSVLPAMAPSSGNVVIVDPGDAQLYRTNQSGAVVASFRPHGLPPGVISLSFADGKRGWALASTSRCLAGKSSCTTATAVLATADGGQTWRPVLRGM